MPQQMFGIEILMVPLRLLTNRLVHSSCLISWMNNERAKRDESIRDDDRKNTGETMKVSFIIIGLKVAPYNHY